MKKNNYLKLFTSTFYISAFTFGGGYVIVPLMRKRFVEDLKWIDENEMLDLIAVAQSSPGASAINTSILVGYKVAGVLGALLGAVGTALPPFAIISVISLFYTAFRDNIVVSTLLNGMQAGVAAVIADVVFGMAGGIIRSKGMLPSAIMILVFLASYVFKINVIIIIIVCGIIGAITANLSNKKRKAEGK